jgi:two-component system, sporulation sensor kinase E
MQGLVKGLSRSLRERKSIVQTNPLAAINSVALGIGRFSSLTEMLDHALRQVLEVLRTEAGGVYLLDEERGELGLVVHRGLSEAAWRDFDHLGLGEGLSGRVVVSGEPIVIRNLKDDPRLTRMAARTEGFQAFASVPLRSNFKTYGTLNVHTREDREFSESDVQLLTSMASQIGLAVANTRLYLDLRASERRFRGLVENAEDLIYLTDRTGRIVYANHALALLLGRDPASLDREPLTVFSLTHPDLRDAMADRLTLMLRGEVMRAIEVCFLHADNSTGRWFSQTNVPLRDQSGDLTGMQCIAHDITSRRDMQTQVAQAQRLADIGRMAATIAHEIRNPLGAIVNSIDVLRRAGTAQDPQLLDILAEETERLNRIVGDFLMFARPSARHPAPCDVSELLRSAAALFRRGGGLGAQTELRVTCDESVPMLTADPNQMRQVLWNLLANASESMEHGRIELTAVPADDGRTVVIAVADEGPGVAEGATVFEPFFTTKAQGTGLGLSIVARIVSDHGGTIGAETRPSGGAVFTVRLPVTGTPVEAPCGTLMP